MRKKKELCIFAIDYFLKQGLCLSEFSHHVNAHFCPFYNSIFKLFVGCKLSFFEKKKNLCSVNWIT